SDPGLLDRLSLAAVDEGVVAEWARTQAALSIGPAAQLAADRQITTAPAAPPPPMMPRAFLILATAAAVGVVLFALPARDSQTSFAVLDRQAKARFSDSGVRPHEGDRLKAGDQFTLVNGFIELRYGNGVQCVVEAPSTFQVPAGDRLDLLVGAVSVSVPPGAEGFQVHGPSGVVTDLGTRMAVHVGEAGDTSLHVVEGKAKLRASGVLDHEAILVEGAAATAFSASSSPETVPHDATRFRTRLPDRLVSYACTEETGGGEIASLLVQRGGREIRYSADQLIFSTVTSFNCTAGVLASGGYVVGTEDRSAAIEAATSEDHSLITGVINAGGPAMQHGTPNHPVEVTNSTPGITFAFPHPVVNLAGPDLVVFDIQSAVQDSRGDAFIIRPTIVTGSLRCHTVEAYDITYDSPYALRLPAFYQHLFDDPVRSLGDIRTAEGKSMLAEVAFKALAVAVDLSDLGYPIGARVGKVFLQDAGDDSAEVDPVLVAGFPSGGGV
ncbi:MAG: FecR domain-containing protein, partial [Planctomycetota bacterium]